MDYAIGIILVPDEPMYSKTIELSQGLENSLSETAIPHITLLQAGITEENLKKLKPCLETIAQKYVSFDIVLDSEYIGPMSGSYWLNARKDQELNQIHREIISGTQGLLHDNVNPSMFAIPLEINPEPQWVKDFLGKASLDHYKPHITLGIGRVEADFPILCTSSTLGVYQLGKGCSAAKELFSISLK
jgi:hypothetical protein